MYTKDEIIERFRKVHGDEYDYSKVEYKRLIDNVEIICKKHGSFFQSPHAHIKGQGCPKCGLEKRTKTRSYDTNIFIEKAKEIHGNRYDYSKVNYVDSLTKVTIICPKHGEFLQRPDGHLNGKGCKKCSLEYTGNLKRITKEEFINRSNLIHNNKYIYNDIVYTDINTKINILCPIHGNFEQVPLYHMTGSGCPKCGHITSKGEKELLEYIKEILPNEEIIENNRKLLSGTELDIYIPSKKIAFEYDGLYWHNEINKPDINYHLNKTNDCKRFGIRLIHIFEDEWETKQDICKSRIKTLLGVSSNTIYARKCTVKEIDGKTSSEFIKKNHIQGNAPANIRYGLYYNDELVSVMTFSSPRIVVHSNKENNSYELLRFCNKINYRIIGGASKLLKHFIREYNPSKITSYADKRWSDGNLYEKIGFTLVNESKPSYYYIVNNKRIHRFSLRKDILVKKYGCKKEDTEHNFCLSKKWYRIYDCGTLKYEYDIKTED